MWLAPVLVVIWLHDGLTQHGAIRWLMIGLAAVYAVLTPAGIWQWRRAADRYDDVLSHSLTDQCSVRHGRARCGDAGCVRDVG